MPSNFDSRTLRGMKSSEMVITDMTPSAGTQERSHGRGRCTLGEEIEDVELHVPGAYNCKGGSCHIIAYEPPPSKNYSLKLGHHRWG